MCRDQDHWKASCSRVHHAVGELEGPGRALSDGVSSRVHHAVGELEAVVKVHGFGLSSRVHHAVGELEVISRYSLIYKNILTFYRLKTRCLVFESG